MTFWVLVGVVRLDKITQRCTRGICSAIHRSLKYELDVNFPAEGAWEKVRWKIWGRASKFQPAGLNDLHAVPGLRRLPHGPSVGLRMGKMSASAGFLWKEAMMMGGKKGRIGNGGVFEATLYFGDRKQAERNGQWAWCDYDAKDRGKDERAMKLNVRRRGT